MDLIIQAALSSGLLASVSRKINSIPSIFFGGGAIVFVLTEDGAGFVVGEPATGGGAIVFVLTEDGVGFVVGEPATGGGAIVFVLTEDGVEFVVDEPETGGGATVFVLTEDGVGFDAVCVGDWDYDHVVVLK